MNRSDGRVGSALGSALVVLGVLWLLLTGGCTVFVLVLLAAMAQSQGIEPRLTAYLPTLGVAAAIIAPGAGLVWGGWVLRRR